MTQRHDGEIRIGISGWTYKPWRGEFYPKDLPQSRELAYASGVFNSIEVNGTFYRLQTPEVFATWAEQTPADFLFAIKGPRFITHRLRLRDAETALANFLASGVLRLGPKLGPILWQLPPNFRFDEERIARFLAILPRDAEAASRCAAGHDERLSRAWLDATQVGKLRHALEIRHESFRDPAFIALLRRHDVALVCADTVEWPRLMDLTSDFVYCRLHGSQELYRSGYDDDALARWADRVQRWSEGRPVSDGDYIVEPPDKTSARDVFFYFDNTDKLQAPDDARSLMRRLGRD